MRLKFQDTIEQLLKQKDLYQIFYDENNLNVSVDLSMDNFDDLHIERLGFLVAVGHYYKLNGDNGIKKPDPVIKFVITKTGDWFPFKSELILATYQYAHYRDDGGYATITHWGPKMYKDAVEFIEMFSENILAQGWDKSTLKYVLVKEIKGKEVAQ